MFVLASQSPRRREILGKFFENFKVVPSNADEDVIAENPRDKAIEVARRKAWEVYNKTGGTVVGADTIVVLGNRALGKPKDKGEAKEMLKLLSGKIHEVITGYCIIHEGREITPRSRTSCSRTACCQCRSRTTPSATRSTTAWARPTCR